MKPSERIKEIISDIHKSYDQKKYSVYPSTSFEIKWRALNQCLDELHGHSGAKPKQMKVQTKRNPKE